MLEFIKEKITCWEKLQLETKPIYVYGMGDGAEKIMAVFREYGIKVKGFFASDEFVRGHSFLGYKVKKLSDVEETEEDFVIVLAFAAGYPELIEKVRELSRRHTLYVPDVPVFGSGLFTYDYCLQHASEIQQAYELMADELSKKVYASVINFKISGNIDYLDDITTEKSEVYNEIIKPNLNEHYVDLGAYTGDTIQEMLDYTKNKFAKIYALEPDRKNFKKLEKYVDERENITIYNNAVWCIDTQLPFSSKSGRQSSLANQGAKMIESRSVDSILGGKEATIIKMDVEGAEREALWGSCLTITKHNPRLMVALYHRNEDIFELPLLVNKINPKYKLYVRHQLYIPAWETNLYAKI